MSKKVLALVALGVVILIAVITALVLSWDDLFPGKQVVSEKEPIDVTLDFFDPWLSAARATSTDPYTEKLHRAPILSKELRKKLKSTNKETVPDPVTCQSVPPPSFSSRPIFQTETEAQVLVMSTQKEFPEQAVVTLRAQDGGWYIYDITCSGGEFAPEREFDFDREGFLLKSVPPPYNPENWHIVFEENGQFGHAAPLFFSEESSCIGLDGASAVCNPEQFREATKVLVQGSMSEWGVQVKKLQLLKD